MNFQIFLFGVLISLFCVKAHVIRDVARNLETGPLEINIFKRQSTDTDSEAIPESAPADSTSTESTPASTIVPIIDTTEVSETSTPAPTTTTTTVSPTPLPSTPVPNPCNCSSDTSTNSTARTTTRVPVVKMTHNPKDGSFQPGYVKTETGPSGTSIVAAAFGKNRTSSEKYGDSQVLYASVGDKKHAFGVNYNFEVGLRKASSHTISKPVNATTIAPATNVTANSTLETTVKDATVNSTSVSSPNTTANGTTTTPAPIVKGSEYGTKILTAGGEFGAFAAMAKASLFDVVIKPGRVGVQAGVNIDTGYKLEDGVEFKVLGVGGYLGKRGIQACVIFCFGILW